MEIEVLPPQVLAGPQSPTSRFHEEKHQLHLHPADSLGLSVGICSQILHPGPRPDETIPRRNGTLGISFTKAWNPWRPSGRGSRQRERKVPESTEGQFSIVMKRRRTQYCDVLEF